MRIEVPPTFRHPGELSPQFASRDPRALTFAEREVEIDLRSCRFVRPAAAVWCLIYPLLARIRNIPCRLLVPDDMGVCVYLKSLGLFELLKQDGIEVDDRGVYTQDSRQIILPLTHFTTESDVESLINKAYENLGRSGLGAANIHPIVSEVFGELAMNAAQHAQSPIGAYGFIQFYDFQEGSRFICAVGDGGVGIRRSLEQNLQLIGRINYDWDAVALAIQERVSSSGDPHRGIGLYGVAEEMRGPGRQMIVHSGQGWLEINEQTQSTPGRTTLFPGTLVYVAVST